MTPNESVSPWFLYIIETKYHHLYTGITTDWQRRLHEHKSNNAKSAKALKGKGPLTLKYCSKLANRRTAMQAEIWLKKQSRPLKLAIINQQQALPFAHDIVDFSAVNEQALVKPKR